MKSLTLPLLLGALLLNGCATKTATNTDSAAAPTPDKRVVLYCSIDEVYAKPLIEQLKKRTGLKIVALFDTESTKTAGLTNRIRAEKSRPRADVLWTSALLQTLLMQRDGLLDAYDSPAARDLAPRFRGRGWAGVGTRARLLVAQTGGNLQLSGSARALDRLTFVPADGQKSGHSNPQFGTASDEAAALYARDPKAALVWYQKLKAANVRILPGNGDVARAVADGDVKWGWTDTDDFLAQKERDKPVFAAQTKTDNVIVPGAVALIKGAPHSANARALFDAIASKQGEAALVAQMPGVFSLRGLDDPNNWKSGGQDFTFLARPKTDDYSKWPQSWDKIRPTLARIFQP